MSLVNNFVLLTNIYDVDKVLTALNPAMVERFGEYNQFMAVNFCGGTKNLEHDVFTLATNHIDTRAVVAIVASIKWDTPRDVILLVSEQESIAWQVCKLTNTEPNGGNDETVQG